MNKSRNDHEINSKKIRSILWRWGSTMQRISNKQADVKELQKLIDELYETTLRGHNTLNTIGDKKTATPDPTAKTVEKISCIKARYTKYIEQLGVDVERELQFKYAIDDLITKLPYINEKVLRMKYEEGRSFFAISANMHISEPYAKYLEKEAIKMIAPFICCHAG